MLQALRRLVSIPHKRALLRFAFAMRSVSTVNTASALHACGALAKLGEPRSVEELAGDLDLVNVDLLRNLLEHGVRCRLLCRRGSRYVRRGALTRVMASPSGSPLTSMIDEMLTYHHAVFRDLPGRLCGDAPAAYLDRYGTTVAESSRLLATVIVGVMREELGAKDDCRILEIGCGAGEYLEAYASTGPGHTGVGLDLDADVVRMASRRIEQAGLTDRFDVRCADVRAADGLPAGPFDVVTAHQNVYYFDAAQRLDLWRRCRAVLAENGRIVIVTPTSGGPMSDYFDMILRSTQGCTFLPAVGELLTELDASGFRDVRKERLIPGDEFWSVTASAP